MPEYPAQRRYKAKNVVHCSFDLNRSTDADLLEHLQRQPNRAAYLKRLIRQDMEYEYAVVRLEDGVDKP